METVIVDQNGGVTIPPEILKKRGLSPGDALSVRETEQGWLVSLNGNTEYRSVWWDEWWAGLTEEEREKAREEAEWYLSLSEEEQDAIWNIDEDLAWVDEEDDEEEDDDDANWIDERPIAEDGSSR